MFPLKPLRFINTEPADFNRDRVEITYEYLINPAEITFVGPVFNYDEGFNKASVVPNRSTIILKNSNEVLVNGSIDDVQQMWQAAISEMFEKAAEL